MKKLFGIPLTLLFYGLGVVASKFVEHFDSDKMYSVYNWLMCVSLEINDWCGYDWWREADEHEFFGDD